MRVPAVLRARRQWAALAVALLVALGAALAVGSLGATRARTLAVFPLPSPHDAVAAWLPDGTPIFVVRDRYGEQAVRVVRARVPWGPIDTALHWCRSTPGFEDSWLGATFRNNGTWTGGPVRNDPVLHQVTVRDDLVHVGPARPARMRAGGQAPPRGGAACFPPPGAQSPDVVDHGWSRAETVTVAAAQHSGHWQPLLVRGVLVQEPNGQARLCAAIHPVSLTCEGPHLALGRRTGAHPARHALEVLMWGPVRGGRMHRPLLAVVLRERGFVEF